MDDRPSLRKALEAKKRVYNALVVRHIAGRYGRQNLGFLWVIIEPMILCVGVMGTWTITKGETEHGLKLAAIVYSGYMPLTLWRHMTNSMAYVLRGGKWLTNYRGITQIDIVLARMMMEFVSVTAAALIVFTVMNQFGVLPDLYDVSTVLIGWLTMAALGVGGGLLIAGTVEATEVAEKFIQPLQYLMLPFSGCFFMLDWLPSSARDALLYVPFVHAFETFRAGMFGPDVTTYGHPPYALLCALLMAGCGMLVVEWVKDRVEA